MSTYLPERFARAVHLHVFKNHNPSLSDRTALILGISGPAGEGKTFNTQHALDIAGVRPFLLSGGQLENADAGRSAELLRETYAAAGDAYVADPTLGGVALVINDIDTALGSWGDMVQYTVNRQTVFGELMHLCDYPTSVDNKLVQRVPIIVTGNNFSGLYGPMVRPGRMVAMSWVPTVEERSGAIATILPFFDAADIRHLQTKYQGQSLSFFSHVRNLMIDEELWRTLREVGTRRALSLTRAGKYPKMIDQKTVADFEKIADEVVIEHNFKDFVGTGGTQ
jgi:ATPase family protein associated with various cellular activities (AAA)